ISPLLLAWHSSTPTPGLASTLRPFKRAAEAEMYVTRPLSWYQADASAAAEVPPEGPGSGFLVVVDETGETARTHFWGLCVDREMRGLPFPQNRQLALRPSSGSDPIESVATAVDVVGAI
uniref:Uncharacterized protein n=1 Tax=Aegilops tauschii subsp. strangulata TaxID=200361 RepID=A0A453SV62_AEGTS